MTGVAKVSSRNLQTWASGAEGGFRILCFPHAGAGGQVFKSWASHLPGEVGLQSINLPGRAERLAEPPLTEWGDLVRQISDDVLRESDQPTVLFGHSLGATLAFETALVLQSEGRPAMHLFVSGRQAPGEENREVRIHDLPREEFIRELVGLKGTPPEVLANDEMLDLMLPALRADFRLAETHHPSPGAMVDCPVHAFGGLWDEHVKPSELYAWGKFTRNAFKVKSFPGGHFYLFEHAKDVADSVLAAGRKSFASRIAESGGAALQSGAKELK